MGYAVQISSYRASIQCHGHDVPCQPQVGEMLDYLGTHGIKFDSIDYEKPLFQAVIDDRAVGVVRGDWSGVAEQLARHIPGL